MMPFDISPEVEAAIVTLAGEWSEKWASEISFDIGEAEKWQGVFNNRFNFYYTILFRAIIQARNTCKKTTIIKRKRSAS